MLTTNQVGSNRVNLI